MITQELLDKIINKWGEDSQIDIAIEEMGELIQALIKLRRACKDKNDEKVKEAADHVCEELADVSLMMEQLKRTIFPIEEIEKWEKFKIDRITKILDKEEFIECDNCDGCGWYEGGQFIQTTCEKCKGTGQVEAKNEFLHHPYGGEREYL